MSEKAIVMVIGVILIIGGIVLMAIKEEAGAPGAEVTSFAEASEEVHPYFWYGVILLVIGVIVLLIGLIKVV
ncbi:MAG: hypothetical protein R6U61_01085 [Thermoplasmata archaeon]